MPFKITKGDVARQPKMCEEIMALRRHYKEEQSRLAYLGRKGELTNDEQTEKKLKEADLTTLQGKIANLHFQMRSTAVADLANIANVAATEHMATQAAMVNSTKNTELALKQALRLEAAATRQVKTLKKGILLDAATGACHDQVGRTINRMLIATDAAEGGVDEVVTEETEETLEVEDDGEEDGEEDDVEENKQWLRVKLAEGKTMEEGGGGTPTAAIVDDGYELYDGDGFYEEPAIEPKPKAKTRAKARGKAPVGALKCGSGSCDFWTFRQGSMSTHRAYNCMGELHLEIIIDKLKEDFGIEVNVGSPSVTYQEVFTKTIRHRHRLKKQRGGSGLFAEIEVLVGPADPEFLESDAFTKEGKRLQFENKTVGGSIPKEFATQ